MKKTGFISVILTATFILLSFTGCSRSADGYRSDRKSFIKTFGLSASANDIEFENLLPEDGLKWKDGMSKYRVKFVNGAEKELLSWQSLPLSPALVSYCELNDEVVPSLPQVRNGTWKLIDHKLTALESFSLCIYDSDEGVAYYIDNNG